MSQIICKDLEKCTVVPGNPVNRILIPFDNSKHASRVFGVALTYAKLWGASITVASVTHHDVRRSWVNGTPGREKGMSLESVDILKQGIRKLEEEAKRFGVRFDYTLMTSRNVSDSLLSLITDKKIDMVIMGTRGNAMWKEMLMGRVSSTVGLNAECPVLLVK